MSASFSHARPAPPAPDDEEAQLLVRLQQLLIQEQDCLITAENEDNTQLLTRLAADKTRLLMQLSHLPRLNQPPAAIPPVLQNAWHAARTQQAINAELLQRRAQRNAAALRVLNQASGQSLLYAADGSHQSLMPPATSKPQVK